MSRTLTLSAGSSTTFALPVPACPYAPLVLHDNASTPSQASVMHCRQPMLLLTEALKAFPASV